MKSVGNKYKMNKFLESSDSERELRVMADNQLATSFPKTLVWLLDL